MIGKTHHAAEQRCPSCNHVVNAHAAVGSDDAPTVGDLSVCAQCATPLRFGASLELMELTEAEMRALPADSFRDLHRAINAIHRLRGIS